MQCMQSRMIIAENLPEDSSRNSLDKIFGVVGRSVHQFWLLVTHEAISSFLQSSAADRLKHMYMCIIPAVYVCMCCSVKNIKICHPQEPSPTRASKSDTLVSNKVHTNHTIVRTAVQSSAVQCSGFRQR
jgi:La-related protein 7